MKKEKEEEGSDAWFNERMYEAEIQTKKLYQTTKPAKKKRISKGINYFFV